MGNISSINFKKSNAFQTRHNDRDLPPNYLIGGAIECNRNHKEALSLKHKMIENAINTYNANKKPKAPYFKAKSYEWSAVVNITESTTMQELEKLAEHFNNTYGFQCYQIAIHRDEGYIDENNKKHINHHAHLEFITLDENTGKNNYQRSKITPRTLSRMQDEVAKILKMQRGIPKKISKIERIEPRIYGVMKERERQHLKKSSDNLQIIRTLELKIEKEKQKLEKQKLELEKKVKENEKRIEYGNQQEYYIREKKQELKKLEDNLREQEQAIREREQEAEEILQQKNILKNAINTAIQNLNKAKDDIFNESLETLKQQIKKENESFIKNDLKELTAKNYIEISNKIFEEIENNAPPDKMFSRAERKAYLQAFEPIKKNIKPIIAELTKAVIFIRDYMNDNYLKTDSFKQALDNAIDERFLEVSRELENDSYKREYQELQKTINDNLKGVVYLKSGVIEALFSKVEQVESYKGKVEYLKAFIEVAEEEKDKFYNRTTTTTQTKQKIAKRNNNS